MQVRRNLDDRQFTAWMKEVDQRLGGGEGRRDKVRRKDREGWREGGRLKDGGWKDRVDWRTEAKEENDRNGSERKDSKEGNGTFRERKCFSVEDSEAYLN